MTKKEIQRRANLILIRDLNQTFWKDDAAETICETFDELTRYLKEEYAAEIIRRIWNTASEEYGD